MANSVPDVILTGDWTDIYLATGFSVGTSILIQNKTSAGVLVYISATKPSNGTNGYCLLGTESCVIDKSEAGCWVKGNGPICVQNNE